MWNTHIHARTRTHARARITRTRRPCLQTNSQFLIAIGCCAPHRPALVNKGIHHRSHRCIIVLPCEKVPRPPTHWRRCAQPVVSTAVVVNTVRQWWWCRARIANAACSAVFPHAISSVRPNAINRSMDCCAWLRRRRRRRTCTTSFGGIPRAAAVHCATVAVADWRAYCTVASSSVQKEVAFCLRPRTIRPARRAGQRAALRWNGRCGSSNARCEAENRCCQ